MKTEKKLSDKYKMIFVSWIIFNVVLLLDYQFCKLVPNFFFLNSFTKDNVEAYWKAIISIGAVVISLLTFFQTSDKFFHEKRIHNENQKKETIRRYQDLVKSAIEILNDKFEDEGACLFAVQIMQNIASLYGQSEFTRTLEIQSEPFQIISIEGIVCLLKKHLDRVWSVQKPNDEIRQDIVQVIRFLYVNNNGLWTQDDLKRCGAQRFKNVYINMEYFDNLSLKNMEFFNVTFDCDNKYNKIIFAGSNEFVNCIFKCDCTSYLMPYGDIILKKCDLQGFKMLEFNEIIHNKEKTEGTKKIEFRETNCKGLINLNNNIFDSIIIDSCRFESEVSMQGIKVKAALNVCDTEFLNGLDFQQSIFERKVLFKDSVCKRVFHFGDTKFLKKDRIDFYEFYIEEFQVPNWRAEIYEDILPSKLNMQKYKFEDLFEIILDEKTKRRKLQNK